MTFGNKTIFGRACGAGSMPSYVQNKAIFFSLGKNHSELQLSNSNIVCDANKAFLLDTTTPPPPPRKIRANFVCLNQNSQNLRISRIFNFVGGFAKAGKDLKATNGWDNHDRNFGSGTDKYGFAALPGGFGILSINSLYGCIRGLGFWWSATEVDVNRAYYYCIYNSRKGAYLEGNHKVGGTNPPTSIFPEVRTGKKV